MSIVFADRMNKVQKSFIREILKVTENPDVISFAGGLPNPLSFPIKEVKEASEKVLSENGNSVLQYSTTEGYLPLREYIAERYYKRFGLKVHANEILITNGSQQGLDLIGKVLLNKNDNILIERPGYLGAIQAFSIFEPVFNSVPLNDEGVDTAALRKTLDQCNPKLFYTVPNFQNPSGITYSAENREKIADILKERDTVLIEDDPYGEIRFMGEDLPPIRSKLKDNSIMLGSFSKIVAPAMRLGWICAKGEMMEKLLVAKQAADLHSNYYAQRVVYQFLMDNDLDEHIKKIKRLYKNQRDCMVEMIEKYFPEQVKSTKPEGGMFLWITLPDGVSSLDLFNTAIEENVAFVPGDPFYINKTGMNTLRLNYTNSDENMIEEGIKRLGKAINEIIKVSVYSTK
ncbi:aromatic-amino-acid aminotransferase 1 [Clostridium pasteurianum DSM 525 = ATCC 6013]|uniref:Aromatic-amino-acid aminotransferase 1 n=1 Tax=Clostridium pasteurianum DSM 525 = ATCC 6013 TaxID=1262449 RepID=A0A0H3J176_CLOPA|nr:PLP-dependent aminotransferase family protein [Clostridium pasteurianum]AJA46457.1 aromatic-amino-acid aminotransferase 1 [Clostridium pasteurianum DSM 525 = ATCC 6013]AJA50445.1 aromatic-amino-acid aminotransferase 1 [Clostridium pasteurianum DSM 525 = ATCC 6013]AOZ73888.1 aspartate aminotransferase [Clostridium pasteurianum DSM 525 = ATCC 6013]AOZ77685.1 aspartate aminotransferase [Clostridium pasteurianum]ELP61032.1 GntR family transcriptional regulator [Clostridium pasteurianum DSM 525 